MKLHPALMGLSILVAGIIGIIRFARINRIYYPFVFCIWIAGINEILSFILWESGQHTTVNNNVYVLAEALLFFAFFGNMGLFGKSRKLLRLLATALILVWVWENFIHSNIDHVSSWFRIVYSFLIVLMSIATLTKLILLDINKPLEFNNRHILKNPVFLICVGSAAYFTFKTLVEIFWLYSFNSGKEYRIRIYDIMVYINLAANLVYALAVLWMHPKQQNIML